MQFDFSVISRNVPFFLEGLRTTFAVSVLALIFGAALGLVICLASLRDRGIIFRVARGYISFFRTTPEMVLIFWAYFCLPPLLDIRLSGLTAGTIALSLVAGAFIAEIFRAGVQ